MQVEIRTKRNCVVTSNVVMMTKEAKMIKMTKGDGNSNVEMLVMMAMEMLMKTITMEVVEARW